MLKKRLSGKSLGVLSLIMAVCLSVFAGPKEWTVNPADFRYDMSLYFTLAASEYENLDLYEIGAFIDDECRGLAEKLDLPDGGSCLYMRIRSNETTGEVTFKLLDKKTEEITALKGNGGEAFMFESDKMVGMPSDPYLLTPYYNVTVSAGEHGTVNFEDGMYAWGQVLTLQAVADEGYHFESWSDGVKDAERELTVTGNVELSASFAMSYFNAVFRIGNEFEETLNLPYGSKIVAPEAPGKEGYTFSGWGDVPETMPAKDLEFNGSYTVNVYTLTFKIDNDLISTEPVAYGSEIVVPAAPSKEGHTFNGWGEVPATMPATDLEVIGTYTVNSYTVTFNLDGQEFHKSELPYGASITAPEVPAKEGYVFTGWGEVPATMPAQNLVFNGSYDANLYTIVFKIDNRELVSLELRFGAKIETPVAPDREGYTFNGWVGVPETMPASNLEFVGSYSVNSYNLTFKAGEDIVFTGLVAYGDNVIVPDAPGKEGFTFNGWGEVPATMPAKDLEFTGKYSVNTYVVTFNIEGKEFFSLELPYGSAITAPEAPEKEGATFSGWGDVPATMPAHDLVFGGTYSSNYYTVNFRIDGELIFSDDLTFGSPLSAPEAPLKEGYTFSGWGEIPATMPATNLEFAGTYNVNMYSLTFKIDGETVHAADIPYGAEILVPEAPMKIGYSFIGWGVVPATMPASDLEITGSYEANVYTLTFTIDGENFQTLQLPYDAEISAPEAPAKEGYSFSGWAELPANMPAHDLSVGGTYLVHNYTITFKADDEIIFTASLPYGTSIIVPEAPVKEGYSFIGWGMVPETMPAQDLEIIGIYDTNVYTLTFIVDGEVVASSPMAYGATIVAPEMPEKEGHEFSGWGELPSSMPAHDLTLAGTYNDKYYTLIFRADEVVYSAELPFEADIEVPEAPVKEGYTFVGWGDVPATMPARNLEFVATYELNSYTLTFKIEDAVIYSEEVKYGTEIEAPAAPDKKGYSFTGWGMVPATMPASDLEFYGTYEVNFYTITFKIREEVISTASLAFGSEIVAPSAPEVEGYTFSGWTDVPATMPDSDLEITGDYVVNTYTVTFRIGEEVISTAEMAYGAEIVIPNAPEKEGYTFTGWGMVPATMPAADLEFSGAYEVNYYALTFMLNNEVIYSAQLPYGAVVVAPEVTVEEGYKFDGWKEEVPETMPAHEVVIHGTTSGTSAIDEIILEGDESVTICNLNGVVIYENVKADEVKDRLVPGIYIVNGRKVLVK